MRRGDARALKRAAPVFAALGDEIRLLLVARLSGEGALSITRLTVDSGVTRQAVTKHLRVLESAGVVTASKDGRERMYELEPRRLAEARRHIELISGQWDDTLARLRDFVGDDPSGGASE